MDGLQDDIPLENDAKRSKGLRPFWFWTAIICFTVANYVLFYFFAKYLVLWLIEKIGLVGILYIGYYGIYPLLIISALTAFATWITLKKNFVGKRAAYLLLVIYLSISCYAISYAHIALANYHNRLIVKQKVSKSVQTYGEHKITSNRQVVNTGNASIQSSLSSSGIFSWVGHDDTELEKGNVDNLVTLTIDGDKYNKEKIIQNASSAVMSTQNKVYFVKNDLFEYDLRAKIQKTILSNVGDIKSEYQGRIVLTYGGVLSVYDTETGRLNDISAATADLLSDNVFYAGKYIHTKEPIGLDIRLRRFDIISQVKKDVITIENGKHLNMIASNDDYSVYTITDINGTKSTFTIISNGDNAVTFSEEVSGTPNYHAKAKFIDNILYVTVRDDSDGNKYNIVKIDPKTSQKDMVFHLSDNGAGREDWDTDGQYLIYSTGLYGDLILSPIDK